MGVDVKKVRSLTECCGCLEPVPRPKNPNNPEAWTAIRKKLVALLDAARDLRGKVSEEDEDNILDNFVQDMKWWLRDFDRALDAAGYNVEKMK